VVVNAWPEIFDAERPAFGSAELPDGLFFACDNWRLAGRWDEAVVLLNAARPLARDYGAEEEGRLLGTLVCTLNDCFHFRADPGDPLERALEDLTEVAEQAHSDLLCAAAWDQRGLALHYAYLNDRNAGELPEELQCFERGLRLRQAIGHTAYEAESLFHIGLVHQVVRGDSSAARPYFERANNMARQSDSSELASYTARHLGFIYVQNGDTSAAEAALIESLRLRRIESFVPGIASAMLTLAGFLAQIYQRNAEAIALAGEARTMLSGIGATAYLAIADRQLEELRSSHSGGSR